MTARSLLSWAVCLSLWAALFALLLTHGADQGGWAFWLSPLLALAAVLSLSLPAVQ
jgi:hypothetical protein